MKYSLVIKGPDVTNGPLALISGTFEERLKKAKSLGYDGIELMVVDPLNIDWSWLKNSINSSGLGISQIVTGELFGSEGLCLVNNDRDLRQRTQKRVESVIDMAAYLNAMVNIGRLRGRLEFLDDKENALSLAHKYLHPTFKYALERNVKITIEPLNRYETDFICCADEAIRFIKESGFENIGIMLDTFHMNIEETTFKDGLQTAGDRLWHVHIADSNRKFPGSGHINFEPIFSTLNEMGYEAYISAELLPLPDPDSAARETINFLKKQKFFVAS